RSTTQVNKSRVPKQPALRASDQGLDLRFNFRLELCGMASGPGSGEAGIDLLHLSVSTDEERGGVGDDLRDVRQCRCRSGFVADSGNQERVVDAIALGEAPNHLAAAGRIGRELVGQSYDLQTASPILAVPRRQKRRLVVAVRAPRAEDVDHHDLAAEAIV